MSSAAAIPSLSPALANGFARMALANIAREYPTKLDHFINGPRDLRAPALLHPVFWGSFDWHSCVHSHWMLARLLRSFPDAAFAPAIRALFDARFTADNMAGEVAYLGEENRGSFVRTYGWAWLLRLALELERGSCAGEDAPLLARWRDALAPLAACFVDMYLAYLPKASAPLRYGLHPNSAFGLAFALDYARASGGCETTGPGRGQGGQADLALEKLCVERALAWFAADRDYPAHLEPSGNEFLSPALVEADLMRRIMDPAAFAQWLAGFLPGLALGEPAALFSPARTSDHSDPQMVHLDGLNLSRAWCMQGVAGALPEGDPRRAVLTRAAGMHVAAGAPHVHSGDYMGEHWLATFAVMALTMGATFDR